MSNAPRSTTTRDRHRRAIRHRTPPCALCLEPIDYSLPYLHPGEFVVDHIIPLARGGADEIENKQAAHRSCNRAKGDKLEGDPVRLRVTVEPISTSRSW